MSIRRSTRLLTTLTSSTPTTSTLVPPYSHSQSVPQEPSPALRPPYDHAHTSSTASASGQNKVVQPTMKFALLDRDVSKLKKEREAAYLAWAEGLGEETLDRVWLDTIASLSQLQEQGTQVPEIAFHELSQHLGTKSTVKDLKKIGMVIVRDVIADVDAQAAGEEIRAYTQARSGHSTYWHQLLLALRASPSVLSSNSQIMSALTGKEARYIRADTLSSIASTYDTTPVNLTKPWSSAGSVSAHIALSPSRAGTYQTVPSIHAARYLALRPLFKPRQSLISFYDKSGYLDSSNWTLSSTPTGFITETTDLPHLSSGKVDLPPIRAGDMIYSHSSLPVQSTKPGIGSSDFLPLNPLGAAAETQVRVQREAYEAGLPPPHVLVDGTVAVEEAGTADILGTNGGRSVMGY